MSKRFWIALAVIVIGMLLASPYLIDFVERVYDRITFEIELAKQTKLYNEKRTFFGITLGHPIKRENFPERVSCSSFEWKNLVSAYNKRALADEYALDYEDVKLVKPFLGASIATVLVSRNTRNVHGIALCYDISLEHCKKELDDFGRAEELRSQIADLLEEKYNCKMTPYDREPSFVRRFVRVPSFLEESYMVGDWFVNGYENNVEISPKSCFMATRLYYISLFAIRSDTAIKWRRDKKVPQLGYWNGELHSYESVVDEFKDEFQTKDYLILLIQDPNLDIEKEGALNEERIQRNAKERELQRRQDALDAL